MTFRMQHICTLDSRQHTNVSNSPWDRNFTLKPPSVQKQQDKDTQGSETEYENFTLFTLFISLC